MSFFLAAAWLISLGSLTVEQQFTADTLIASFYRDGRSPVKGSNIMFADVVVETRVDKIVFKSSGNDKVICELRAPIAKSNGGVAAGSSLTVTGRVRGRGGLGNVTLDDCSIATAVAVETVNATPSNVMPEPPRVPIEIPGVQVAEPVNQGVDTKVAVGAPPKTTVAPVTPRTTSVTPEILEPEPVSKADAIPEAIPTGSAVDGSVPGTIGTRGIVLVLFGFVVGLVCRSLLKRMPGVLTRSHQPAPTTPEMRRLALEALLARQQKKA